MFAAIVFAVSVFLLFDAWIKEHRAPVSTQPATSTAVPAITQTESPARAELGATNSAAPAAVAPIIVRTDLFAAEIDPRGGVLRRLELREHRDALQHTQNYVLFDEAQGHTYVAQSGLIGAGLPNHTTLYRADAPAYDLQTGQEVLSIRLVPAERSAAAAGVVTQTITFHRGSYLIDVAYDIANRGTTPLKADAYFQLTRDGAAPAGTSRMAPTYVGGAIYTESSKFKKVSFSDMDKGKTDYPRQATDGWVAIVQHYFLGAWLPKAGTPREYFARALGNGLYSVGVIVPVGDIAPGASATVRVPLYAGPQEQKKLAALSAGLDLTVDYGWLTVIAVPLFWVLGWIHGWARNWGVSIIILTVIIKLLFYPLSAASYRSMAKMRLVAPKLQKLKETYGDDRQRMHQAMVELYRTEKINPLGGCLPIVVQIPVFIALYWVLLASVELRHAPFALWIRDLASPDPYYVLPVLMGISMIVQSWMNPTPPDPVQAKVMKIMPVAFSIFFFFFPSGLVLYWLVNNILSIAQQWQITRALEHARPANASR